MADIGIVVGTPLPTPTPTPTRSAPEPTVVTAFGEPTVGQAPVPAPVAPGGGGLARFVPRGFSAPLRGPAASFLQPQRRPQPFAARLAPTVSATRSAVAAGLPQFPFTSELFDLLTLLDLGDR